MCPGQGLRNGRDMAACLHLNDDEGIATQGVGATNLQKFVAQEASRQMRTDKQIDKLTHLQ